MINHTKKEKAKNSCDGSWLGKALTWKLSFWLRPPRNLKAANYGVTFCESKRMAYASVNFRWLKGAHQQDLPSPLCWARISRNSCTSKSRPRYLGDRQLILQGSAHVSPSLLTTLEIMAVFLKLCHNGYISLLGLSFRTSHAFQEFGKVKERFKKSHFQMPFKTEQVHCCPKAIHIQHSCTANILHGAEDILVTHFISMSKTFNDSLPLPTLQSELN